MDELILETSLTPEEIAENFKNFDLTASLEQTLKDIEAYQRGEEVPGLIVHERSLPDVDQMFAPELVKKQILAWDPDFTKATPEEHEAMEQAITELDAGEYVTDDQINWD